MYMLLSITQTILKIFRNIFKVILILFISFSVIIFLFTPEMFRSLFNNYVERMIYLILYILIPFIIISCLCYINENRLKKYNTNKKQINNIKNKMNQNTYYNNRNSYNSNYNYAYEYGNDEYSENIDNTNYYNDSNTSSSFNNNSKNIDHLNSSYNKNKKIKSKNSSCNNTHTTNNNQNSNETDTDMYEEDKIFDKKSVKVSEGFTNSKEKLNELIGLNNVKEQIKRMQLKLEFDKKREKNGIKVTTLSNKHMLFYGPPGTGKTTVARILTGIFYNMGIIKENKFVEINGELMKGAYFGHTAIKTKAIIDIAMGGVLFVDEAYLLKDKNEQGGFGKEAIGVLLKEMEDNKDNIIVIFAGYENEMNEFIDINPGLKSRIGSKIYFDSYNENELIEILQKMSKDNFFELDKKAIEKSKKYFSLIKNQKNFGNARYVELFLNRAIEEHAYHCAKLSYKNKELNILREKDIIKVDI